MMALPRTALPTVAYAQRGVSLLFTLLALVVIGFAGVALTRSVETGTLIVGNLSLKQDATVASFSGAEQAISWLKLNLAGGLDADQDAKGFYASSIDSLDPTGNSTSLTRRLVKWNASSCTGTYATCNTLAFESPSPVNGNKVQWVITRLCAGPGAPSSVNPCARPPMGKVSSVSARGEVGSGGRIEVGSTTPYFRIIVRVEGPRNTVSFTESLIHF